MTLHQGDCLEVMAGMEPGSVDAVVTDPPAGIGFMSKDWDHNKGGRTQWVAWMTAVMRECLRVLKPGGWLVCWSLPRTSHWTAWAIEDAGFRLTDVLLHVFASGFPKGRSQMKPAYEPWILARKPGPLRELAIDACRIQAAPGDMDSAGWYDWSKRNVGRVPDNVSLAIADNPESFTTRAADPPPLGRWPSNVLLTSPLFDGDTPGVVGGGEVDGQKPYDWGKQAAKGAFPLGHMTQGYGDSGTYSRFFLIPKADRAEREPVLGGLSGIDEGPAGVLEGRRDGSLGRVTDPRRNVHPTVKPLDLMRHLVRLVTPTGGTVLDPFLGSGTTALAAEMEGFAWIGVEKEAEYCQIIEARLNGTQRGLGLDVGAPLPRPRHVDAENTTAKRASYGRKPHEGSTWRLHGHPPIEDPA